MNNLLEKPTKTLIMFQLIILSFIFAKTEPLVTNNTKIIGTVINSETKLPIQYSSVTLINNESNKIISGQLTDNNGYFTLSNPGKGNYRIEVEFIGFLSSRKNNFIFDPDLYPILNLGTISIQPKPLEFPDIEINTERPLYQVTVDKKIYVIDQLKTASGGTCCDVMKKVPSLDLGPNGEISLRGSDNVSVLVNGKRTGILGDERKSCAVAIPIPATMIDRIEIITSPSAEYDPDGITGIINIILKDEKVSGYNGEVSINAGNTNKFNLGAILSYRTNKLHLFSKFSTEIREQRNNGYYVTNVIDSLDSKHFEDNELYFMNLGAKYDISERTLFTSEAKFTQYFQNNLNNNTIHYDGDETDAFQINSQNNNFAQAYDLGFYTNFLNDSKMVLEFSYDEQEKGENRDTTNIGSSEYRLDLRKMILKADYHHKLNNKIKYETGYKGRFNTHNKNYGANDNTNIFQYNENIHALYGTATFALTEKLQLKTGARFEQTLASIILDTTGEAIETPNNYNHIYPSAYLAYVFSPYSNLKFAYSSRVNRPEIKMLDLFPQNQFSSLVDTIGNPNLKPEFVDAFEISYTLMQDKYKADLSLYHHNIKNVIQWYNDIDIVTYNNSGKESLKGIDIMLKISPLTFWDFTFTGNYYSSNISDDIIDGLNGNTSGGIIRGISMFKMPNGGDLEFSSTHLLSKKIITGTVEDKFTLDIAYQISLYDDRLKLTCKAINILDNDIYDQNIGITDNNGDIYNIHSYKKYSNRTFYITMQYKFGTLSM